MAVKICILNPISAAETIFIAESVETSAALSIYCDRHVPHKDKTARFLYMFIASEKGT